MEVFSNNTGLKTLSLFMMPESVVGVPEIPISVLGAYCLKFNFLNSISNLSLNFDLSSSAMGYLEMKESFNVTTPTGMLFRSTISSFLPIIISVLPPPISSIAKVSLKLIADFTP